jgi:hypothetical protein
LPTRIEQHEDPTPLPLHQPPLPGARARHCTAGAAAPRR